MSEETGAPVGGSAVDAPVQDTGGELTISQAARLLSQSRRRPESAPVEQPVEADPVEPDELAEANAEPADKQPPSEEPEAAEPEEEVPPIEPPRSWTKAEKERFQSLPRETQEYLHTREQEREREFRRSQNEIADQRKAVQAEREVAEKARQQYEANLPAVMQALQDAQQSTFADIKTISDVEKLQIEDPFRFQQWQVQQMKLQATNVELERSRGERSRAEQAEWAQSVQKENELAAEFIPELADKVKGPALIQRVASELLPELGFKDSELADLANGKLKLSIYDHRIQRLLADAVKLRDIKSAPKAVAAKPLPPVQRPGISKPSGSVASEKIQALQETFNRTGSLKDAQALHAAETARRRA